MLLAVCQNLANVPAFLAALRGKEKIVTHSLEFHQSRIIGSIILSAPISRRKMESTARQSFSSSLDRVSRQFPRSAALVSDSMAMSSTESELTADILSSLGDDSSLREVQLDR
jgi:hypothetical protein